MVSFSNLLQLSVHVSYDFLSFICFIISLKGSTPYTTGENSPQFGAIVGQVNLAHQPPMVRFSFYNFFSPFVRHLFHNYFGPLIS